MTWKLPNVTFSTYHRKLIKKKKNCSEAPILIDGAEG